MSDHFGLAIDPTTNDIFFEAKSLAVVRKAKAVGQHVRQRLMTFQEEWFLDVNAGVPWLDRIMGKQYDPALAESLVKVEILRTHGVTDINAFSVSFARVERNLIIQQIRIKTEYDLEVRV